MDYFQYVLNALFQPFNLTLLFSGVIIGIIFGAIPGLTGALAIVLLLPFTFMMKSEPAIILLVSIYIGGISGGFIASTLIGIPGTPASIATTLEAWPLAKKGGTVKALGIGIVASFIGTFFSGIIAMFLSPVIAEVAVKLCPWEFFGLCLACHFADHLLVGRRRAKGTGSCLHWFSDGFGRIRSRLRHAEIHVWNSEFGLRLYPERNHDGLLCGETGSG